MSICGSYCQRPWYMGNNTGINWILSEGTWRYSGVWIDNETWDDGV